MSEALADVQAVRTIEQGHIRVGTQPVTDPAMLITRRMEDFVTWVDTSARKRTIMKYNDEVGPVASSVMPLLMTSLMTSIYCNASIPVCRDAVYVPIPCMDRDTRCTEYARLWHVFAGEARKVCLG